MNSINQLFEYLHGYKVSYLIMCAAEWKLFDELLEPVTSTYVAERLFLNKESTEMVLNIFAGLGFVKKNKDKFCLEAAYRELLMSQSESSMMSLFELEKHLLIHHNTINDLREAWKFGKGRDRFNENCKEGIAETYGMAMNSGGQLAALHVARAFSKLDEGLILDLGGGTGTYAQTICRLNKNLKVHIYDQPEMEKFCIENLKLAGLADRITFKKKNLLDDRIDDSCKGILISNVLHLFNKEENKVLLQRCANALELGGILVLHDFFLNEEHTGSRSSLLFSLDWLLIGSNFNMSRNDVEDCVQNLGLKVMDLKQFDSIPTSIIILKKEV